MPFVRSGRGRNAVRERHRRVFGAGRCAVLFSGWAAFLDASVLLGDARCFRHSPTEQAPCRYPSGLLFELALCAIWNFVSAETERRPDARPFTRRSRRQTYAGAN